MESDARQVVLGSSFSITVHLVNIPLNRYKGPRPGNAFKIIGGPFLGNSVSIVNGKRTERRSFTYRLQAQKLGTHRIRSARVNFEGEERQTEAVDVEVLPAKEGGGKAGGATAYDLFMRAELSTDTAYTGQQVILDYKLYTTVEVDNFSRISESEYSNFYAEKIDRYPRRSLREVIDGVEYTTQIIHRMALFPQQAGQITIDPLVVQAGIRKPSDNNSRRLLPIYPRLDFVDLRTGSQTLVVLPLPADTSGLLDGAVGRYQLEARLETNRLTTDDALRLYLILEGEGDIKRVQAPPLHFPPSFEPYEPEIVREQAYERNGKLYGRKVFEYQALPTEEGTYTLIPRFAFFHPDSNRTLVLRADSFPIIVTAGSGRPLIRPQRAEEAISGLRPLHTGSRLRRQNSFLSRYPVVYWALLFTPFMALGLWWAWRQLGKRGPELPLQERRRLEADKLARQQLDTAADKLQASEPRAFYQALHKTLLDYATDKYGIPRSELSRERIQEVLKDRGTEEEDIKTFRSLLDACERARFGSLDERAAQTQNLEAARRLMSHLAH